MRLRARVALLAMLLLPSLAHAQAGIAMRWDHCYSDGGTPNKNFACDTNAGSNSLTVSFSPPSDMTQITGNEVIVDVLTSSAALPSWWEFRNPGSCRLTSLGMNAVLPGGSVHCTDVWQGNAAGGVATYNLHYFSQPNRPRILFAVAVPADHLGTAQAGHEYFSMNMTINNQKTTGTGSCTGCTTPVCLLVTSIKITQPVGVGDVTLYDPLGPNSNAAAWQGGSPATVFTPPDTTTGHLIPGNWQIASCGLPTPARNQTWGAIKSLYR
jgi:hypothetical protein